MIFSKGAIVKAVAGRDKGKLFTVIDFDTENKQFLLIADGRSRRLECPKKKSCKHLVLFSEPDSDIVTLLNENKLTNSKLRRAIAKYEDTNANN